MNLLKANQLNSRRDVLPRGIFRLFWCAIGYALSVTGLTLVGRPLSPGGHGIVLACVFLVPFAGVAVDGSVLRSK